jgi:hypothetical protein
MKQTYCKITANGIVILKRILLLKKCDISVWTQLAENEDQWCALVNTVMTVRVPQRSEMFHYLSF